MTFTVTRLASSYRGGSALLILTMLCQGGLNAVLFSTYMAGGNASDASIVREVCQPGSAPSKLVYYWLYVELGRKVSTAYCKSKHGSMRGNIHRGVDV
eukprot:3855804-Amphidinium_carterae.1